MEWWMWVSGGLLLMVLELATPSGFFIMFFGLGGITVGLLARLGIVDTAWVQWLLFTALSLVYVLLFRGRLQRRVVDTGPKAEIDAIVGNLAIPREAIAPGAVGRVEVRGALWNARNEGSSIVDAGQRCRVTRVDGLLVSVQPE